MAAIELEPHQMSLKNSQAKRPRLAAASEKWIQTKIEFCSAILNIGHNNSTIETSIAFKVNMTNLDVKAAQFNPTAIFLDAD